MSKDYHELDEKYNQEDPRAFRKERKRIQAKDRSKYKKTDQEKRKNESTVINGKRGRVLGISKVSIDVDIAGQVTSCNLKGSLKKEKTNQKNLITVGDYVLIDERGQIAHIEERFSYLARAANLDRRKQQLIAANIDQVLITASYQAPTLKPSLLDRYIIAAQKGNMQPIIVINKIDLCKDKTLIDELCKIYKQANIPLLTVSALTKEGITDLKKIMRKKTSVFSGQSGVGKTSLINEVTGRKDKIGPIIQKTQKGAHTTTSATLIPLDKTGFCVDTPGIKSFGLWDISSNDLSNYFYDLLEFAPLCKFMNCTHIHEPDCAVKKAVEEGKLSKIRYESYLNIHEGYE